jgi:hypothetical protein
MPNALLLQDTPDADAAQDLLAGVLAHLTAAGATGLEILVPFTGRPLARWSLPADAPIAAEPEALIARAVAFADGRALHAVACDGVARLWIRNQSGDPALAWRGARPVGRRHPLLPVWRAMEEEADFLLGAPEASAHRRLLQAARAADVPVLKRLAEVFAARPARLWRRGQTGVVLYGLGPQGEIMANGFEAVILPVSDVVRSPSAIGDMRK